MPFLLLIVGMLCGALVCLLVISTTLAAGSFRISRLQQQNQALVKQQQALQQQVAQDQAPSVIAQRAEQLGMRPVGQIQFLNVKTGKISSDAATGAAADIKVPGYTP
jgi:cell division protein FtsB